MRKLITILILLITINSFGQDVVGNRIIAKSNFYLRNTWIDSLRRDTLNWQNDLGSLPTAGAVYKFVLGRVVSGDTSAIFPLLTWDRVLKNGGSFGQNHLVNLNGKYLELYNGTQYTDFYGNGIYASGTGSNYFQAFTSGGSAGISALFVNGSAQAGMDLNPNYASFYIGSSNFFRATSTGAGVTNHMEFHVGNSDVDFYDDSLIFRPSLGKMNIDSLRSATDTTKNKPVTWNTDNGMLQYLTSWPGGGSGWGLTGTNAIAGTNFIGTTNNVSFRFRTNNIDRGTLDSTGILGIGTMTPSSIWGGNVGMVVSAPSSANVGYAMAIGSNAHAIYTSSGTNLNFFSKQLSVNYLIAADASQTITTNWEMVTTGGLRVSQDIFDPTAANGRIHYNTTNNAFMGSVNGVWRPFLTSVDTVVADEKRGTPIGTLFTQTGFASTTGYTVVGTAPTISNNMLLYVGGGSASGQNTNLNYYTNLQEWQINLGFKVGGTINSTSFGVQVGIISANTSYQQDIMARFEQTNVAGSNGYVEIFGSTAHNVSLAKSATNLSFSVGDSILLQFNRNKNVITVIATNLTTNSTSVSATYTYLPLDLYVPNTGTPAISMYGGTDSIYHFSFTSQQAKNVDILTVGDSKMGWYSNAYSESIPALIYANYANSADHSGGGDKTAEVLLTTSEIIALKPKTVLLTIGSNDVRNGISAGTYEANIDTIYNRLTAAGIEVRFALMYETSIDQATLVAYENSTYPNEYIDEAYESTQDCASCLYSDNIHMTELGNLKWTQATLPTTKLDNAISFVKRGTYTPTLTGVANVSTSTAYTFMWSRVNDIITVSGEVDIDPTTTSTLTRLGISFPIGITSDIANTYDVAGTSADDLGTAARIAGDATNNRAELRMTPVDVTNRRFSVTFQFRVL